MLRALAADTVLLRCRPVVWVICAVALLAIGVLATQSVRDMAPPTEAQMAMAEETYRTKLAEWEAEHEQWEQACIDDGGTAEQCAVPAPTPEAYQPWQSDYPDASRITFLIAAALLGMAMYVAGAMFVGGAFVSGAMTTWLTHHPGRLVLTVSKLIVMGVLALGVGVLVFGGLLITLNLAARAWGVPVPDDQFATSLVSACRATLLGVFSAVTGAAASFITRRTALAVGLAAAYVILNRLVVSFNFATGVAPALDLITQGQAWVGGTTYLAYWDAGVFREVQIDPTPGGIAWAVLTVLMVAAALLMQRLRDPQ